MDITLEEVRELLSEPYKRKGHCCHPQYHPNNRFPRCMCCGASLEHLTQEDRKQLHGYALLLNDQTQIAACKAGCDVCYPPPKLEEMPYWRKVPEAECGESW